MNQNFLISTPIQSTWPKPKKNSLVFSSESAIFNINGKQKKYKNYTVTEFRWRDKKKLSNDYKYIDSLYEKLLKQLRNKLNSIHSTNHSIIFWRILLGPWLATFLQIYFERWKNVETAFKSNRIDRCIFLDLNSELFTPYDVRQFCDYSYNDLWNQFIYQDITEYFITKGKIIKNYNLSRQKKEIKKMQLPAEPKKSNLTSALFNSFNTFNKRNYKYFFYQTYLGAKNELNLSFKFKQSPIYSVASFKEPKKKKNKELRKNLLNFFAKNNFEKALKKILNLQMPSAFLENFSNLEKFSNFANIPQNPKLIFTSNACWFDTKIAYHIAKLKENKTKLYYSQHGGTYGISKILWPEKHERDISDKFLSWGWNEKKNPKIIKFGMIKNMKINKERSIKKNLLLMLRGRLRYFYSMDSSAGTEPFSEYIKINSDFLFELNKEIKSNTIIRLPHKSTDIKSIDFYSNLEKKFNFYSKNTVQEAYSKSKLIIHTMNSTSFLETFSENLPSILILKRKLNPMRSIAKAHMEELYNNNIVFDDPVKAAIFVNSIWKDNIDIWWNSRKNQYAIKNFCNLFARKRINILADLKNILQARSL